MKYWISLWMVACTGESVIEKQSNKAPVITIQSHGSGAQFVHGTTETFRALVSDGDHDAEDLEVGWYVGEELVCSWENPSELGESACDILLEIGDSSIVAEVRDAEDLGGRAEIAISVLDTQAPTILISSPLAQNTYQSDQLIQFIATIADAEDSPGQLTSTWFSSVDGLLALDITPDSSGRISDAINLSVGQHYIELRVQDSDGKLTTEAVIIDVIDSNEAPVLFGLGISPASGVYVDTVLTCSAIASDAEDGSLTPTYSWDLAGTTFQGATLDLATTSAMIGDTVSCIATATDSGGISASAATFVVIENRPPSTPVISISPSAPIVNQDDLICSILSPASDPDGQSISYNYYWLDPAGLIQQTTIGTAAFSDVYLAAGTSNGAWTCQVEASDGVASSSTSATVSVSSGGGPCTTTWNPNDADPDINFLNNNMTVQTSETWGGVRGTSSKSSGKWYYEAELIGQQHFVMVGVGYSSFDLTQCCTGWNGSWGYYLSQQELRGNHSGSSVNIPGAAGWCNQPTCTIGVAVDVDTGEIWWSMEGVWQLTGNPASSAGMFNTINGTIYPQISIALNYTSTSVTLHTCAAEMEFAPPAGFSTWD